MQGGTDWAAQTFYVDGKTKDRALCPSLVLVVRFPLDATKGCGLTQALLPVLMVEAVILLDTPYRIDVRPFSTGSGYSA